MKTYIFLYSNTFGSVSEVTELIDSIPQIVKWRTDIPNSFMLKSDLEAKQLADFIIGKKANARFLISEITENRQGWLPKEAWNFIKDKDNGNPFIEHDNENI